MVIETVVIVYATSTSKIQISDEVFIPWAIQLNGSMKSQVLSIKRSHIKFRQSELSFRSVLWTLNHETRLAHIWAHLLLLIVCCFR